MMSLLTRLRPSATQALDEVKYWLQTEGPWWATSITVHAVAIAALGLLAFDPPAIRSEAPAFESVNTEVQPPVQYERMEVGESPVQPTELNTETLSLVEAPEVTEQTNGPATEEYDPDGGGFASSSEHNSVPGVGGLDLAALGSGPAAKEAGGIGLSVGNANSAGAGGAGEGFAGRGRGMRRAMLSASGGTKASERSVGAALNWFARHQNPDGSWSLDGYSRWCSDPTCAGKALANADTGATAMALLPFLAAGQTHKTKGPYKQRIATGLAWLLSHQKADGNLAPAGGQPMMYSHGLATITLCEAYGLTGDKQIGLAAQKAVNFIAAAQSPADGGWRYKPGEAGDTSVVGWQVMGLKSAQIAGLVVPPVVIDGAHKYLKKASKGNKGGLFAYLPDQGPSPAMTAAGLLCTQYLGAKRTDPSIQEGTAYLMQNLPDVKSPNIYYWYYGTQVMHNVPGKDWDVWNRRMRRILIDSQAKESCATGSWNPAGHPHGEAGGRIMATSLSCLTLEVYYRYLPLYKLDSIAQEVQAAIAGEANDSKTQPAKQKAKSSKPPE